MAAWHNEGFGGADEHDFWEAEVGGGSVRHNRWSLSTKLVNFGWGQYDFNEEAKLLGENKMRKN